MRRAVVATVFVFFVFFACLDFAVMTWCSYSAHAPFPLWPFASRIIPEFVHMLYEDQPLQCRNCGRRFPASQQAMLDDHYDWHFRMNRVRPSWVPGCCFSTYCGAPANGCMQSLMRGRRHPMLCFVGAPYHVGGQSHHEGARLVAVRARLATLHGQGHASGPSQEHCV